jgi:hypothetical protein
LKNSSYAPVYVHNSSTYNRNETKKRKNFEDLPEILITIVFSMGNCENHNLCEWMNKEREQTLCSVWKWQGKIHENENKKERI